MILSSQELIDQLGDLSDVSSMVESFYKRTSHTFLHTHTLIQSYTHTHTQYIHIGHITAYTHADGILQNIHATKLVLLQIVIKPSEYENLSAFLRLSNFAKISQNKLL